MQAAAVGALVSHGVGHLTRRLLPLAALMRLTLIFPDQAPSRFGVALRSGTVKQMRIRAAEYHRDGLGSNAAEAAENAIVLVNGLGRHDRLTRGHTERVRAYADLIAEEMGLSDEDRNWLAWGVLLHDVGKIEVPSEILNKKDRLTDDEWHILKQHPAIGAAMLRPLAPWLGEWLGAAAEHHERWDGNGYPNGLAGNEISLAGRITAVADAYDVITSKRSYKEPMSDAAAREELVRCSGGQFDPVVVRAMLNASVGRSRSAGWLAWLTEIPAVRAGVSMVASPVVGAAAITTAAVFGLADDSDTRRRAFAAELEYLGTTETTHHTPLEVDATTSRNPGTTAEPGDDSPSRPVAVTSTILPDDGATNGIDDAATTTTTTTTSPVSTSTTAVGTQPSDGTAPTTVVPSSTLPDDEVPAAPTTTASPDPGQPASELPSIELPSIEVPSIEVPSIEVPTIETPVITTPRVTVPSVSIAVITTPQVTVPPIIIPSVTTPPITTPAVTTPPLTTPPVTTPSLLMIDPDLDLPLIGGLVP